MNVRVGVASDIGQVREGNEDSYLVQAPLYAVADGMGGHRGGEVASSLALETVERLFAAREGSLAEQVEEANRAVFERSRSDRAVAGMGTTLTAALLEDRQVRLAHVGDSRAYLLRDGSMSMLTQDHTLVARMVAEGEITAAEAETHPHRSILTRALGVDGAVEVDEDVLEVRDGDRLLLCTDGLTGMVDDATIERVLLDLREPQQAVEELVRRANGAGGVDNITALILDFADGDGSVAPEPTRATAAVSTSTPVEPMPSRPPMARTSPRAPEPRRGSNVVRLGTGLGVALALLLLAFVGLRLYTDSQWFVGVSDGRVAIFRGVPAEFLGFELHHVVTESSVEADEATALALYRDLDAGITADDREAAEAILEQIRVDVSRVDPAPAAAG